MPLPARAWLSAAALALMLAGCATGPRFDAKDYDRRITPQAVQKGEAANGTRVLWGGMIINTSNFEGGSELEILAYPLITSSQRPDTTKAPLGRFIARTGDYLESVDYAQGRLVTVAGPVTGTRSGMIGEAHYTYAVVEPETGKIYLWPVGSERGAGTPHFSIGLGVLLGH